MSEEELMKARQEYISAMQERLGEYRAGR